MVAHFMFLFCSGQAYFEAAVFAPRIARHLWRMCLGLTLAAGSAFTNGVARFLPGPYHVPRIFFLPQRLVLGLLIIWMVRVRLMGWRPAQNEPRVSGTRETAD